MSLKSQSEIYDRLEKYLAGFTVSPHGLTGKEPTRIILQRFAQWLITKAADDENNP